METIKSKKEFEQVFHGGQRVGHRLVRITVLTDEGGRGAVAFVAPKRLGNAVFRNRCKRVLREAARACDMPRAGEKVILFATHATHDSAPGDVAAVLPRLLRRAAGNDR